MSSPHQPLIDLARAGEPERCIAATLAAEPSRAALLAIAAFAADLRQIPDRVKEPMMGEIRLQWWRDTLDAMQNDAFAGADIGHPVADALKQAIRRFALPPAMLIAMTEARAFDLYADPLPDQAALDGYLWKTEGVPFALALQVVTGDRHDAIADAAGKAFGLTRQLTDWPKWQARGRLSLPLTTLEELRLAPADAANDAASVPAKAALDRLRADAASTYADFLTQFRRLPRADRLPLLPLAVVKPTLRKVAAAGESASRQPTGITPLARFGYIARTHAWGL